MECIMLRLQDGAMFFPLDEIRSAKGTTSAGLPAIAFTGRNTGGLQFIKLYREREERDRILQAIAEQADKTEQREAAERLLADRLRETKEELERMRDQLSKEKAKKKPKPKSKKPQKAKPKPKKDFVIPETSEIVEYIKEKGIDEKLKIPAEVIAESFRSVYEKEEDTGEKDESGAPIIRTVWRKANGSLVENWKSCLQTFKARQLVWDAKQGEKPAKKPFNNQFNQFEQNEYTDEELDEIINSSVS